MLTTQPLALIASLTTEVGVSCIWIPVESEAVDEVRAAGGTAGVEAHACFCLLPCHMVCCHVL
jgi:hypothetical protein